MSAQAAKNICAGRFPIIERQSRFGSRTITVFGYTHGHGNDFGKYGKDVVHAMDQAISGFGPGDYILAEGYETELAEKALSKMRGEPAGRLDIGDHIHDSLLSKSPRLRFCERFEWHSIFPWNKSEQALMIAEEESKARGTLIEMTDFIRRNYADAEEMLSEFFQQTWIDRTMVEEGKRIDVMSLVRISGLPEEDVRKYVEKKTTFRSLLAARTSFWRAEIMDTKLFVGVLHAAEVSEFLSDQGATAAYVNSLPDSLRAIYETNESYQKAIMGECLVHKEQAVSMRFLPLFVRWLAYKAYDYEYEVGSVVDFSEYRQMLAKILKDTGRNEPCPCFSGNKFKSCCAPLLEALQRMP